MLLIFKTITAWRRELGSVQLMSPRSTHYRHTKHMLPHNHDGLIIRFKFLNILVVLNSDEMDKEINKKLPEDDLIEDRNMLECFLKYFK
jgi:hypothetical protein